MGSKGNSKPVSAYEPGTSGDLTKKEVDEALAEGYDSWCYVCQRNHEPPLCVESCIRA